MTKTEKGQIRRAVARIIRMHRRLWTAQTNLEQGLGFDILNMADIYDPWLLAEDNDPIPTEDLDNIITEFANHADGPDGRRAAKAFLKRFWTHD